MIKREKKRKKRRRRHWKRKGTRMEKQAGK
jgi:hypothetical protein